MRDIIDNNELTDIDGGICLFVVDCIVYGTLIIGTGFAIAAAFDEDDPK